MIIMGLVTTSAIANEPLFKIVQSSHNISSEKEQKVSSLKTLEQDSIDALNGRIIKEIEIKGITNEAQLTNAKVFLTLEKVKNEVISQPNYVNYLITNGAEEIKRSQQPFGYYNVSIDSERIAIGDNELKIVYQVNLNTPTKIRTVDVSISGQAKNDPVFQKILANNPLHKGEILNHQQYEVYKNDFLSAAVTRGYFDGVFTSKLIAVNTENNTADIDLHYDSGQRYVFDNVHFVRTEISNNEQETEEGKIPLDEDLLQRFVQFQAGQPYNAEEVATLQQDLQGSGYFKQVLVGGNPDKIDKDVPVEAQLIMNRNKSYLFGIGYSTDSGARARFDFDRRWVNSRGHTFSSSLYISQKDSDFDNVYRIPAANPTTDYYYLRAGGWIKNDKYHTKRAFIEGGYNWRKDAWEYRVAGVSAWEKFHIGNDKDEILLTYPRFTATYTSTKNRLNPESGFQARFGLLGGIKNVGSDINFIQGNFNFRYIHALNEKNRVIARFDGGADWTDEFHRLPPSLRYFAGGDRSIRGYRYESIGGYDKSGQNIGGKYLAVGSLEYEYYFKENWAAAAFVDAGDAFSSKFDTKVGAGVGLHWRSPVGPIKIDLGHGFNPPGDKIRLHINIGAELNL